MRKKEASEDKIFDAGDDKDKLLDVLNEKIKSEHPSDGKLKEDLMKLDDSKVKQIALSNKVKRRRYKKIR